MTENVNYEITSGASRNTIQDIKSYISEIINSSDDEKDHSGDTSRIVAIELDYMTNYTVKILSHILDYYKLSKRRLNKSEMVQIILIFEEDPANEVCVSTRRQLWKYMERLRNDEYLSKFILFNG
tara:strand:- start:1593 stop:1967 length:375 start_codon:yes stop_codon:yes gene_type:complete